MLLLIRIWEAYISLKVIIAFSDVISPVDLAAILVLLLRYLFR